MNNKELRKIIKESGVKYWQIAEKMNINDGNFSRRLRKELNTEEKNKIMNIIAELKEGGVENE